VLREEAAEIEALGYGAIWFGEVLWGREALTLASVLLGATEQITVATGIANVHLRSPAAADAGARLLATSHPGRFVLGLGASHKVVVEDGLRRPYGKPLAVMRSYLDEVDACRGRAPESRQPGPPRVLAALGPRMLDLARSRAHGAHTYCMPVAHTRMARERLGPDRLLAVEVAVVLDGDRHRALRRARAHLAVHRDLPNYRNAWIRAGFSEQDCAGALSDRLVEALVARGDEDAIRRRVGAHREAGADHVCILAVGEEDPMCRMDVLRRLAPVLVSG